MRIAILSGGDSSEHLISVKSAWQVKSWLEKAGHTCYLVLIKGSKWSVREGSRQWQVDRNRFGFQGDHGFITFDFAWNVIHGTPGEDGRLQGYLDMMSIPYNTSNHLSSALTFNKYTCKTFLKQHQVLTPEARLVRKGMKADLEEIAESVGIPCFVKPNNGGSSFGTTRVMKFEQLETAIETALKEDGEVIIERYIKGTEVTCGLMKTRDGFTVFPITEIVTDNEFFDYEAKYTRGKANEITPARIDEDMTKKCQQTASMIYDLTFSSGIVRVDFIIKGNQLYFLELNSIPGMTPESIVPQQVECMGVPMEVIFQQVIDHAIL